VQTQTKQGKAGPSSVSSEAAALNSNYLLKDINNIEQYYIESGDFLFRKDIIKLYYFPQEKTSIKEDTSPQKMLETADG
jgi:ADP-glucose pyrophosphorylase